MARAQDWELMFGSDLVLLLEPLSPCTWGKSVANTSHLESAGHTFRGNGRVGFITLL